MQMCLFIFIALHYTAMKSNTTLTNRFNLTSLVTVVTLKIVKLNLTLNILNQSLSQVKFGLVNFNLTRLNFTEVTLIS